MRPAFVAAAENNSSTAPLIRHKAGVAAYLCVGNYYDESLC